MWNKLFLLCVAGAAATRCSSFQQMNDCLEFTSSENSCMWCFAKNNSLCMDEFTGAALLQAIPESIQCVESAVDPSLLAPVMPAPLQALAEQADYVPVVFMHGLGDSAHNPGMKSLATSVMAAYPGMYSLAIDVANGISSFTTDIGKQVAEFAAAVKADPKLSRGFTAAGLSQGGLIVRVYAQLYNDPPVLSLVSLCGPQEGVGECPGGVPEFFCNLVRDDLYGAPVSFAGYWKNVLDKQEYLVKSRWLADWNNERDGKNTTYSDNLKTLRKVVLIEALNDTTVVPHISESFGFYTWGNESSLQAMRETEGYQGDWLGLKTLDEAGKIHFLTYAGEHLRWSSTFWHESVMPQFNLVFPASKPQPRHAQHTHHTLIPSV